MHCLVIMNNALPHRPPGHAAMDATKRDVTGICVMVLILPCEGYSGRGFIFPTIHEMIGRLQVRLGENTHENGLFSAPCPSVFIVRDDTWFATHAGCAWEPGARCTERPAASTRVVYAWHGYPVWSACVDIRGVERRANETVVVVWLQLVCL